MRVAREIAALELDRSRTIGLVPTMGAFHDGHLSLMRQARQRCDELVVSLFVNPTQFGKGEDFEHYPRDEVRDFELAETEGVDLMFTPTVEEMYGGIQRPLESSQHPAPLTPGPPEPWNPGTAEPSSQGPSPLTRHSSLTTIHVAEISELWEGAFRPGHFDGVATVVAKLFNIVRPNFAIFGEKDYQQCCVIERMVADLNMPVELVFVPTVREPDGLAMSSRNVYLSPEHRAVAPRLYEQLHALAKSIPNTGSDAEVQDQLNDAVMALSSAGFKVEYLELVDADSLEPKRSGEPALRLIVAARLGQTRLIDNVGLVSPV